jgi:hypothetical protein
MTVAKSRASVSDQLERHVITKTNRQERLTRAPIRATLIGSNRCEAEGLSARGYAPVFQLCRELVAAGFNPAGSLEAWRGQTFCLRIRSIGEAARLTVEDDGNGTPRLRRWRNRPERYGAGSPVAQIANGRGGLASLVQKASGRLRHDGSLRWRTRISHRALPGST